MNVQEKISLNNSFFRFWRHLGPHRRHQFILLLVLMIVASFAEVVSIGTVIPFLGALTNPEIIFSNQMMQPFINYLGINTPSQVVVPLTLVFCFFALLSGVIRLILLKFSNHFSFATGADLSLSIYKKTLYQPYKVHISRNTSEIINGISSKSNSIIYNVILPSLTIISSSIMLIAILSALVYVNPLVCLAASASFGFIYIVIAKVTKNQKIKNSHIIADKSSKIIKSLQEGLGGIRDVLIDGCQKVYLDNFRQADLSLRQAQARNQFVAQSPRYLMESLGMVLIAVLAFYLFNQKDGLSGAIPVLGIIALGAQRLLPVMQQAYTAWSSIQGSYRSLEDILDLLDQPMPIHYADAKQSRLKFSNNVALKQVNFRYASQKGDVISDVNISIGKGERVGIIGVTGSGKSTLVDILMGLLEPTSGLMSVDDKVINNENVRAWQKHIAHVPQSIFLADTTIAQNIALGFEEKDIDLERVRMCAEKAQLNEVISNLPEGYGTVVGERGVRLSGGQRQRIAIARAFYKDADVLVFDEATSALDNQTENSVMQAIEGFGREVTVIIIAHRLTTLKKCSKIIELVSGKIVKIGAYKDITNQT